MSFKGEPRWLSSSVYPTPFHGDWFRVDLLASEPIHMRSFSLHCQEDTFSFAQTLFLSVGPRKIMT